MNAENVKIVLSGTPIINYPNEIAILMNMLRGHIKTYKFKLNYSTKNFNNEDMKKLLYKQIKMLILLIIVLVNQFNCYKNPFDYKT